ncbi:unnamed protein product [Effrenium voratum]|nr:unnamed protein product [Effrenium voratum]
MCAASLVPCRGFASSCYWQTASVLLAGLCAFNGRGTLCDSGPEQDRLKTWLKKHGGYMKGLSVKQIPGRGKGLVKQDGPAASSEMLLRVPWKLVLHRDLVDKDPRLQQLMEKWRLSQGSASDSQAIRFWLLHSDPEWAPWLELLPQELNAGAEALPLALAFSGSEALRGTALQREAEVLLEAKRSEWHALSLIAPMAPTWERFLWAQAIVSTRSSTLPMGPREVPCLVPVLDFANHGEPNACIRGTGKGVELVACKAILEGEESLCRKPGTARVLQKISIRVHANQFLNRQVATSIAPVRSQDVMLSCPPARRDGEFSFRGRILISYGAHSAEQFLFAFGFFPPEAEVEPVVPLRSSTPLVLRANKQGVEELLGALGEPPGQQRAAHRLLDAWLAELRRPRQDVGAARALRERHAAVVAKVKGLLEGD